MSLCFVYSCQIHVLASIDALVKDVFNAYPLSMIEALVDWMWQTPLSVLDGVATCLT